MVLAIWPSRPARITRTAAAGRHPARGQYCSAPVDVLSWVFVEVFTVLTVVGLAAAARRLLGIRLGTVRTLLAGALAFAASGPLFQALAGEVRADDPGVTPLWFLALAVALALLAGMAFLVVAEVLVPTGSVPPPYEWPRAIRGRVARTRRYARITRIAFRHGLGRPLRGRSADPASRDRRRPRAP